MARHKRAKKPLMRRTDRRPRPGAPPGTLVADPGAPQPVIRVLAFGPDQLHEEEAAAPERLPEIIAQWPVTWVDVEGLGDAELIQRLGELFGLHELALEDVIHAHQRPKVEDYDDHIFIATQMTTLRPHLESEQVSLFLGKSFVLTFQERPSDCFDAVRERIRKARGIRQMQADYLAYALIDATIDTYFPILERYGELTEDLEAAVLASPQADLVPRIHHLKTDLLSLRRLIWPQRDMVNALVRDFSSLIEDQTRTHLRDCYDHTIQLLDMLETHRELASGLIEIHLSEVGTRTNEIMKVLTIIATIFIPLSFIAGLYGMNFDRSAAPWSMPELGWRWGYPFALALMMAIALGLLGFFRSRGWIGPVKPPR
jgi:magnesium transporter